MAESSDSAVVTPECVNITLTYSPAPRQVIETALQLPPGATVADALRMAAAHGAQWAAVVAAVLVDDANDGDGLDHNLGIWGRKARATDVLHAHDRVEIYRPLVVDPKVARRERFRSQGARGTGLFAKRRPGAKPGY